MTTEIVKITQYKPDTYIGYSKKTQKLVGSNHSMKLQKGQITLQYACEAKVIFGAATIVGDEFYSETNHFETTQAKVFAYRNEIESIVELPIEFGLPTSEIDKIIGHNFWTQHMCYRRGRTQDIPLGLAQKIIVALQKQQAEMKLFKHDKKQKAAIELFKIEQTQPKLEIVPVLKDAFGMGDLSARLEQKQPEHIEIVAEKKNHVYLGRCVHRKTGEIIASDKKIGRTNDISVRRKQFKGEVNMFFDVEIYRAWYTNGLTNQTEKALQAIFYPDCSGGEFFQDENNNLEERIANYMKAMGHEEVPLTQGE